MEPSQLPAVPVSSAPQTMDATIESFESVFFGFLETEGLPTSGVRVDLEDRGQILRNFSYTIRMLDAEKRVDSIYLSKFVVAVAAGLVDAALNYLWDETVTQLRSKIEAYDLQYFFEQVTSDPKKREKLTSSADLTKVNDFDLLSASKKIGLISELGYTHLDLVREMRNHASAAHPNQNDLGPMSLLSYLEVCIREVIAIEPNEFALAVQKLLSNVKSKTLDEGSLVYYKGVFEKATPDQIEAVAKGLFAIATNLKNSETMMANVILVWPLVWNFLSEDARAGYGFQYGNLRNGMETKRANRAKELLDTVQGLGYVPDSLRAGDINEAVQALHYAHHGRDNFYNEPAAAKTLLNLIKGTDIPAGVSDSLVKTVVKAFIGNIYGVSHAAVDYYEEMIANFNPTQSELALVYVTHAEVTNVLNSPSGKYQLNQLLEIISPRIHDESLKSLLEQVRSTPRPDKLHLDSAAIKLRDSWLKRSRA